MSLSKMINLKYSNLRFLSKILLSSVLAFFATLNNLFPKRHLTAPARDERRFDSLRGSYTVEASVILPVYLCLCCVVLTFFTVLTTQCKVQSRLSNTVTRTAVTLGGISHDADGQDTDVKLQHTSTVTVPVRMFGRTSIRVSQQAVCRRWTGWDPHEYDSDSDTLVYVTESGSVYHLSRGCSYLNPSIHAVGRSSLDSARNASGGRYRRCPLCGRQASGAVYITDDGSSWHSSRGCSGLKRTVFTMKLRDAQGRYPSCSRCGN